MPRPIPRLTLIVAGYTAMHAFARSGTSVSTEGREVEQKACEERWRVEGSQSLFGSRALSISEAQRLAEECGEENWDGDGARAVSPQALETTLNFIRAIPFNYPAPEIAVDPDGALSLDWIHSRHRIFSLSIGTSDRLAFAWLDGGNRGRGVVDFDGSKIPAQVLTGIRTVIGNSHASLRLA